MKNEFPSKIWIWKKNMNLAFDFVFPYLEMNLGFEHWIWNLNFEWGTMILAIWTMDLKDLSWISKKLQLLADYKHQKPLKPWYLMQMVKWMCYDANVYARESQTKSRTRMKIGGKFFRYDNFPYLIFLDLKVWIVMTFKHSR